MSVFFDTFKPVTIKLWAGFLVTLKIFGLTLIFALPLGLIISFGAMSKSKFLRTAVRIFVWIIRGTPLMLQIVVIYFGPGLFFEVDAIDRFLAVIIAFVINYACYFSEIFRGGIISIDRGQYEAGQVLGLTKKQVFFRVVLLQVIKRIIPPMSNEIITLVKDTSLARTIAVYEIIWNAQKMAKFEGLIWPIFYTGVFYLLFCGILTLLFGYAEKKMSYFRS